MKPTHYLQGAWRYELDDQDRSTEKWLFQELPLQNFILPGTTASNKIGKPVMIKKELTKEAVRCLREEYKYLGAAYYQTDFVLGDDFAEKRIELFLERVMFESMVWIDENQVDSRDSLSTPHVYDITRFVEIGKKHILTIRIDNRDIQKIGPFPSAYTDETQTIWNGIVGRVEIIGQDETVIHNVVTGLKAQERQLFLSFDTEGIPLNTQVQIDVSLADGVHQVAAYSESISLPESKRVEINLALENSIQYWDEFSTKLYELEIKVAYPSKGSLIHSSCCKRIGLRELTTKEGAVYINGSQSFLRGNVDCCVFPITAYPPMDYEAWLKICKTTKDYGLNHIRFHSWCPPEAAFMAADEIGLYLQVEGPVWMDDWTGYTVGCHKEHYTYLLEEALRIVEQYSHHPSFCIFSNGNELNGDYGLLEHILTELRKRNPYLLYTISTNWDRKQNPVEDIYVAQSIDGNGLRGQFYLNQMVEGTTLSYDNAVKLRSIPAIAHEVGQYVVYPNVYDIPRFTGVLKPVNLESIQNDLVKKQLYSYVPEYIQASGKLAAFLYKSELEAALRTENFGGLQLLSLQDFPGQSTATIGLLDCFYQSKNIITPEEFRAFCNSTVLLVKMPSYRYLTSEAFEFELLIAHYYKEALENVEVEITLEKGAGNQREVFWSITATIEKISIGLNKELLRIKENLFADLKGRNAVTLTAKIPSKNLWNSWDIWVYEAEEAEGSNSLDKLSEAVEFSNCYETLCEEAARKLEAGESVIIFAKPEEVRQISPGKFFPVFWSPVHFESKDPCGMIINNKHPLFEKYYPVNAYADIEWKNLLEYSFSINIDSLNGFEPLTMPVPNFFHNHKVTNLMEANVSNGRVILCSLDLKNSTYPEIRSFQKALKDYYVSGDFNPTQTISLKELQSLFQ